MIIYLKSQLKHSLTHQCKTMGILQLNSHTCCSLPSNFNYRAQTSFKPPKYIRFSRGNIRAISTISENESETTTSSEEEPPSVDFAFVSSVLLPDGTPDVQLRSACGGQKLRNVMLDSHIELYGPYARPLLNCGGGGTCGTCMVEVVQGKELLSPRTQKEKEILKRKPKNWRLACQTTVGKQDSRGQLVIQQLPEWKAHEWNMK